jgi:hypothetical protein
MNNDQLEAVQAGLILGLLLADPRADADDLDWDLARRLAQRDRVLLRLAERIERSDTALPPCFAAATAQERAVTAATLDIVARLDSACASGGIPYVILKLAHQLPDTGGDVDLLVDGDPAAVDRVIQNHVPALSGRRRAPHRITGRLRYVTARHGVVVDVHHGRVGPLGEDRAFAALLLRQRRQTMVGDGLVWVPSPEDLLIVEAMQVYSRRTLRLGDIYWVITTAWDGRLDWQRVLGTARQLRLVPRLSCFLDYVGQVHAQLFERPLLPPEIRGKLELGMWGKVAFRRGAFRFPSARARGLVWLEELPGRVSRGDLAGAGRLCLWPVATAANRLRRIGRRPAEA